MRLILITVMLLVAGCQAAPETRVTTPPQAPPSEEFIVRTVGAYEVRAYQAVMPLYISSDNQVDLPLLREVKWLEANLITLPDAMGRSVYICHDSDPSDGLQLAAGALMGMRLMLHLRCEGIIYQIPVIISGIY